MTLFIRERPNILHGSKTGVQTTAQLADNAYLLQAVTEPVQADFMVLASHSARLGHATASVKVARCTLSLKSR